MLIKPWNEVPPPRHTFEDEFEESQPAPIPTVGIELKEKLDSIDYIIIAPKTVSVLNDSLPKAKAIGTIVIDYPQLRDAQESEIKDEDLYDEDEQLYTAIKDKSLNSKYSLVEIPIVSHQGSYLTINVPHFSNIIVYNILAKKLVEELNPKVTKFWITLSPCNINNNQSLNKLLINSNFKVPSVFELIPNLNPPHFITGISASITSQLNLSPNAKLISLVLNSEGHLGFEKIANDSIIDTGFVLAELLLGSEKDVFLKKISLAVRKLNSFSNSGMYI